jgi:hypothetical protein
VLCGEQKISCHAFREVDTCCSLLVQNAGGFEDTHRTFVLLQVPAQTLSLLLTG